MEELYVFNSILGCLPKEYAINPIETQFYVKGVLVNCTTNNNNPNYSKSVLKIGKRKYAYIFRITTTNERSIRKYIINTEEELLDEMESL